MIENLLLGLATAATPMNLLLCLGGVFLGTAVGVLPGIGPLAAIAMLLPLTFHLPPEAALVMLAGVYYGNEYGGSTTSILLNIPGSPSSSITCIDGYPMARSGRAGLALFMTAIASFAGGVFGISIMAWASPSLADFALMFGPAEYFSIMLLGLVAAAIVSGTGTVRGGMMVFLGVLLGTVGMDVTSGTARFTGGILELRDGIGIGVIAVGIFGVAEVIAALREKAGAIPEGAGRLRAMWPGRRDLIRSGGPAARGAMVGAVVGALPGTGQNVASFMAYALEKKVSPNRRRFGQGALEGVVAPEAANSAAAQTSFIPTLTLGIPGSPTMALMLGALMIHGITPGPRIIEDHPDLFWGLVVSFLIGNLMLVVLNIPLIGIWVRLLAVPPRVLYPATIVIICVGAYSIESSLADVWLTILFGVLGYLLRLWRFEPAPLLIGFVLGPMMEEYFRRAMLLSRGDATIFLTHPGSALILAVTAVVFVTSFLPVGPLWTRAMRRLIRA
ncbi:tripartite tricarboxylate transporter permease [Pseudogemmobacter sonorensis]|uniref:tripartite tricarboxylate transporter permease n=1 Tax=Pseudogemmobacter sonorensis TaxID=2989681 RepID=UPI0036CE4851